MHKTFTLVFMTPHTCSVPFRPAVAPRTSCGDADIPPTHRRIVQEIRHQGSRSRAANNGHGEAPEEVGHKKSNLGAG